MFGTECHGGEVHADGAGNNIEIHLHIGRFIPERSGRKGGFRQEGFPVPELNVLDKVVVVIRVGVLVAHFHFHSEFLSLFSGIVADDMGCMAVEVILSCFGFLPGDIDRFEYSWHGSKLNIGFIAPFGCTKQFNQGFQK